MNRPRIAGPGDISELVRLINAAYRVEEFFIDGDRTNASDIAARMQAPDASFLVVDGDPGSLAATVCVTLHGNHAHFGLLAVDPDRQRQGLARSLITAVEEHCRAAGCRELEMDFVNLREELPAVYAALGFIETGETATLPAEERLTRPAHLVRMWKRL